MPSLFKDNLPYFGKRDIFYYFEVADKSAQRDTKLAELFGEEVKRIYYAPLTTTDKIYRAKFWKDESAIIRAKGNFNYPDNMIIHQLYREDWINIIPDGLDEKDGFYLSNLHTKKKEVKANVEWLEFRKKYKASNAYTRVKDPQWWLPCKDCGLIPLVWEFNNGRSTACACDHSIQAESVFSVMTRNNLSAVGYNPSDLRMNWNQWVKTGQDVFSIQKKLNPTIW